MSGPAAATATGEIFAVNFIRKEVMPQQVRRGLAYGLAGYLALNALLLVWMTLASFIFFVQAHLLQARLQNHLLSPTALTALRQEMQSLQERASQDLTQFNSALGLQHQRFLVGGKLAALAKTLPSRTWITQLSGKRAERAIDVQAAYLIDPDAPYSIPTKRWIEALRAEPSFKNGLKWLDLGTSSRKAQGGNELFVFDLSAEWGR